jgi:hypothetical protein
MNADFKLHLPTMAAVLLTHRPFWSPFVKTFQLLEVAAFNKNNRERSASSLSRPGFFPILKTFALLTHCPFWSPFVKKIPDVGCSGDHNYNQ